MSNNSEDNKLWMLSAIPIMVLVSSVNKGWAASVAWSMFMPQYFGLPPLHFGIAVALSALIAIILPTAKPIENNQDGMSLLSAFIAAQIVPWLAVFVVFVATNFYY